MHLDKNNQQSAKLVKHIYSSGHKILHTFFFNDDYGDHCTLLNKLHSIYVIHNARNVSYYYVHVP